MYTVEVTVDDSDMSDPERAPLSLPQFSVIAAAALI
jgi:hypothetical protein